MIAGMTYYQICMYFLLYSFLGWVIEVIYHAVAVGKIVNRGFLNGPVCPVYGFGMLAVLAAGNAISEAAGGSGRDVTQMNSFLLFVFGMFIMRVEQAHSDARYGVEVSRNDPWAAFFDLEWESDAPRKVAARADLPDEGRKSRRGLFRRRRRNVSDEVENA